MPIGDMLRQARGERSKRAVALELGVQPSAYRAWEEGFSVPDGTRAEALAKFLGISKAEVLRLLRILGPEEEITRVQIAAATLSRPSGAYLSGPISVPVLALVA
jgi:transcriptional regulator with XRE-family HTH domain